MKSVAFASVTAAPGVTTLCCLLAATWPVPDKVVIAECDPTGSDLAARFELSTRSGWSTYLASVRRDGSRASIVPHLQQLPGGVSVLVGSRAGNFGGHQALNGEVVGHALLLAAKEYDLIVDAGRILPDSSNLDAVGPSVDALAIVLRPDAASIMHVYDRRTMFTDTMGRHPQLVLVGRGPYARQEIEQFTEMRVLAEIPEDRRAAWIAEGGQGSMRRLARSRLTAAARRLASALHQAEIADGSRPRPVPEYPSADPLQAGDAFTATPSGHRDHRRPRSQELQT